MYPLTTLHFSVSWGEGESTNFSEVSGLTMEREVVEYRGGADPQNSTYKQPGLSKFSNVTAKRGIGREGAIAGLYKWFNNSATVGVDRRNVTVMLLNEEAKPVMVWQIRDAWPVKLEGPGLKSTGTDVAVESVEFACEGIEVKSS